MITIDIAEKAPESFIALAWDTFYASRQRGISRAVHMPWLDDYHSYFITVRDGSEVFGGLAVRPVKSEPGYVAGLIGMVCVREDWRGKGMSSVLLSGALSEAGRLGTDDLVLWTGKPKVYEGLGFVINDTAVSGTVRGDASPGATQPPLRTPWPVPGSSRGLPPFAVAGWRWSTSQATAVVIEDPIGAILCEWQGSDAQVAELLAHAMAPEWRIHALADDTLPDELTRRGWELQLAPSHLQMTKQLRPRDYVGDPYRLRMLDRI